MPGIPVVARGTFCSRSSDQMCRLDSRGHLSMEEELAAEESLAVYCKPVEFYNILQRRAISNPSFLQRCLLYRIEARHKRRIQMTISLSQTVTDTLTVFPLYIFLARLVSDVGAAEYSATYSISRLCMFRNCPGIDGNSQVQANFTLPEVSKLAVEAKSRTLAILFISSVENMNSSIGDSLSMVPLDLSSFASKAEGHCLYGKVSLESLYMTWESSPNFNLGQRAEIMSTVEFLPCFLKRMSKQLQMTVSAEEFGAKEKSHYHAFAGSEVSPSSLSHAMRLREGNVIFNYRYYQNKLQRTEVTEDFSCPFCLVKCASFKGLKCHLPSSHDLFSFEFWQSGELLAVNVSVKTDIWRSEMIADGVDPKLQTFAFCAKPLKRRRLKSLTSKNEKRVHSLLVGSDFSAEDELLDKADGVPSAMGQLHPDPYIQAVSENNLGSPAVLQFAKTRKLSVELSDPRNCALLRKRQFFHSHRAQPMVLEQVLSDQDSEDEVDDDVADFEDRRMLDNFVDVTKDEKQIMHMWNSFIRKQRVIADGHIPWACEAFSKLHAPELVRSTSLAWSWRFFMIKLWNHALLDARTMNECNLILERYRKENPDPNT